MGYNDTLSLLKNFKIVNLERESTRMHWEVLD
jgi:hypothetical protein